MEVERSFGVRQLAAAFWPASLPAAGMCHGRPARESAWPGRPWHQGRKQASGRNSGSKLPHSKASLYVRVRFLRSVFSPGGEEEFQTIRVPYWPADSNTESILVIPSRS